MRYDNQHKQRTRQKLIEEASVAIREHGPDNISVAALMAKAGLTHGGFYAHFKSKDDLVTEAIAYILEARLTDFEKSLADKDLAEALAHYVDLYLSPLHRDTRDEGCAVAALSGDVARMPEQTKAHFDVGIKRSLDVLSNILAKLNRANAAELAGSVFTEMVGALTISRTLTNPDLSVWVLNNARASVKAKMGLT